MASLKEIKSRIASIQSTRKITSAMKMVSAAKLHKAQAAINSMEPYQEQLDRILYNFLGGDLDIDSPYIEVREVKRVALVFISSNTSLCGAFNANVVKDFLHIVGEYRTLGQENILVYPIGKKIEESIIQMGFKTEGNFQHLIDKPNYTDAADLAEKLMKLYVDKTIDRVELIYHHFKSVGSQTLIRQAYLPIDLEQIRIEEAQKEHNEQLLVKNYLVEPSVEQLISDLLPQVLRNKIFTACMDSSASEHATRMLAMQNATDNANDLIQELSQQYNKSRQQSITSELLDIIGGSMR